LAIINKLQLYVTLFLIILHQTGFTLVRPEPGSRE
jgi:hypothetical protein